MKLIWQETQCWQVAVRTLGKYDCNKVPVCKAMVGNLEHMSAMSGDLRFKRHLRPQRIWLQIKLVDLHTVLMSSHGGLQRKCSG